MEVLEIFLNSLINLAILLFEYIGVLIIAFSGIQGVINYVRGNPETRLILAKGLAMGLEFKLGGEILRTVIVNSLAEIAIVAGIILLRATLTVLIHWEIKNEQHEKQESAAEARAAAQTSPAAEKKATVNPEPAAEQKAAVNPETSEEQKTAANPEPTAEQNAAADPDTAENNESAKADIP